MAINRENYPEYFLDFFEGRLSEADKADLFVFLDAHPELKEELEAFDMVDLVPDTVIFPDRECLKRGMITPANYEWYFAAYVEGDLSDDERAAVEYFASGSKEVERELRMMQLAVLGTDHAVAFPGKTSLKHHVLATANPPAKAAAGADISAAASVSGAPVSGTSASGASEFGASASGASLTGVSASGASTSNASESGTSVSEASESSSGSSVPGGRRLYLAHTWYYISAAAVVLWLAGLFFLRTPDPAFNNLVSDLPAVEEVDEPKAVAEVPSSTHRPEEAVTRPEGAMTRPEEAVTRTEVAVTRTEVAVTGLEQSPAALTEARNMAEPSSQVLESESSNSYRPIPQQSHLIAAAITSLPPVNTRQAVSRSEPFSQYVSYDAIEYKTEFAYWSQDLLPTKFYTEEEYGLIAQQSEGDSELAQLALSGLQQALPVDFSKVDDHLRQGRIPLKELAGRGLAELGIIATNALGIERETDNQGRTLAIRAGDIFEARRSNR